MPSKSLSRSHPSRACASIQRDFAVTLAVRFGYELRSVHGMIRTTMSTEVLIKPSDLRPPDWPDPAAVAEQIIADLKAKPRSTPPKLLAGQLVALHVIRDEPLPDITVQALAAAMALNRRIRPTDWPGIDEAVEAARKATASLPVARKQRAVVLDAAIWLSGQGLVLRGSIFDSIIRALDLTSGRGALRPKVLEIILPSPKPEMRLTGVAYVEPEDDGDDGARAVWRERPADPRVGLRTQKLYRDAVEAEAAARAERGRSGEPALTYQQIADAVGTDFNTIRNWAATDVWRMDVMSRAYWKKAKQPSRTTESN